MTAARIRALSLFAPDLDRNADLLLAIGVAGTLSLLLVPLPALALDVAICVNIAASVSILLAALFARSAIELTSFPSLLLLTTLFRLGVSVATTRSILTRGHGGDVVAAFGSFVVQGDVVVGLLMFGVLTIIQLLVIAKGAERVAEVGARFTLDAMPGKQMSIDAALRQGAITDAEAERKRDALGRESKLFGNLDGAMKFVKGDAVATLIMTGLNLVAGLAIGVLRAGMSASDAVRTYSILSIGDGLVSQIPSLLITLAAGLVVTRVDSEENKTTLGRDVLTEMLASPRALSVAAVIVAAIGFLPGLPLIPFLSIAGLMAAVRASKTLSEVKAAGASSRGIDAQIEEEAKRARSQESLADRLVPGVVPIAIDLDRELTRALGIDAADPEANELIADYIPQLRDALYLETGVRFPAVRVRGNAQLPTGGFVIRVKDIPVLEGAIDPRRVMAMTRPDKIRRLGVEAERGEHPVSGSPVAWIAAVDAQVLEASGVPVFGAGGVITLHLAAVLRNKAKEFVGLHEVGEMVERMEAAYPALVREVLPKLISLGQLAGVLRRLVDEGVSIRDLKSIFEALGDHARFENDELALTERVRAALAPQLAFAYAGRTRRLEVVLLEPAIEDTVRGGLHSTPNGTTLTLEPGITREIIGAVGRTLGPMVSAGARPAILTTTDVRRVLRKLLEVDFPSIPILSFDELPGDLAVQPLGRAMLTE